MEPLSSFYLTRLLGVFVSGLQSQQIDPYTLAFKFGMSSNLPKRGITREFINYTTASTRRNPSAGKYDVTKEVPMLQIDGRLSCCEAPESMIADFEAFVNTKYFDRCPRLFSDAGTKGSKHEYLDSIPETEARALYLEKVIKKFATRLAELKPQYEELTDSMFNLINRIRSEYKAIFDDMKSMLLKYGMGTTSKTKVTTPPSTTQQVPQTNPTATQYRDPFDNLAAEWTLVLFKGTTIVGLQHNTYHADTNKNLKEPNEDKHVLLADLAIKGSRFQFHDNRSLASVYRPYNLNAVKTHSILLAAGKVRTFDKSQLPPKAVRMSKVVVNPTTNLPAPKPVTNGVNHSPPVTFTNI